jgi:pSer/pThr/pTyr-binding forkhead associated (FHA) protein
MALLAQLVDGVVVSRFNLDKQLHSIGRSQDCDVVIDDISVSGNHAEIEAREIDYLDGFYEYVIRDLESTNGTFVNDLPVLGEQKLSNGDMVRVAWNKFKFVDENQQDLEKTAQILEGSKPK